MESDEQLGRSGFCDDLALLSSTRMRAQAIMDRLHTVGKEAGLRINAKKDESHEIKRRGVFSEDGKNVWY